MDTIETAYQVEFSIARDLIRRGLHELDIAQIILRCKLPRMFDTRAVIIDSKYFGIRKCLAHDDGRLAAPAPDVGNGRSFFKTRGQARHCAKPILDQKVDIAGPKETFDGFGNVRSYFRIRDTPAVTKRIDDFRDVVDRRHGEMKTSAHKHRAVFISEDEGLF